MKKLTGHWRDLNPSLYIYHGQCFQRAKPLHLLHQTHGECYCYLHLALTEKKNFLLLYNSIHCTLDKVFLTQSSRRLKGSDALAISVYTNEEKNLWVQMQLETFYCIYSIELTSQG